jgi:hypothetical protein
MGNVAQEPWRRFKRWLSSGRETIHLIVSSPRRLSAADRDAIRRRIAADADFARRLHEFLDAEPQYRNDTARTPVSSRSE